MVRLALHSIAYEAKTLNLAKDGYTAFYVDGTNGSDAHDGGSWGQAFKTIQYAVDEAEPWAKIFVRAGTYAESVSITKDSIKLIGPSRDVVDIHPSSGNALTISGNHVSIESISLYSPGVSDYCALLSGEYLTLDSLKLDGVAGASGIRLTTPSFSTINGIYTSNSNLTDAITSVGSASYLTIKNCKFNLTRAQPSYVMYLAGISKSKILNNDIGALPGTAGYGIWLTATCSDITIFHNNFISNTIQIDDFSSKGTFLENYYDDHTTDTNHSGLCDTAYSFTAGNDYKPVSNRNGWEQISLGNTL